MHPMPLRCFNADSLHTGCEPIVHWTTPANLTVALCATTLDWWLDNADNAPSLEPLCVRWLDGSYPTLGSAP